MFDAKLFSGVFIDILQKFGSFGPILYSPIFEVPFFHIVVAFEVYVVEQSVLHDEVGGEVVYVGVGGVKQFAHFLHLCKILGLHFVLQH